MKKTLDVTNAVNQFIKEELEDKNFFFLNNKYTDRQDLFDFALALGVHADKATRLESKVGLVRTERLTMPSTMHKYIAIYYDKVYAREGHTNVDELSDYDRIFSVVEEYANTGFQMIIEEMKTNTSNENFMYDRINELKAICENS